MTFWDKKQGHPTILPNGNFNAEEDAVALHKILHGSGTKESDIINMLGRRTRKERREIAMKYQWKYVEKGKSKLKPTLLAEKLSSELSGNLKTLCVESLLTSAQYDATQINKAVKGLGTDETALIEIICSRTYNELIEIKKEYEFLFKRDLENDVADDTSKSFKRLLVSCLQWGRLKDIGVDKEKAHKEARELYEAGEDRFMGTDETVFNRIMVNLSSAQLQATFQEYASIAGHDIEDAIRSEMSGDFEDGLLAIVRVARNKPAFFARQLHEAMKGSETDDETVMRVVLSRADVDMVQIKQEFYKEYGLTLEHTISCNILTDDYRKMLLTLIKEPTVTIDGDSREKWVGFNTYAGTVIDAYGRWVVLDCIICDTRVQDRWQDLKGMKLRKIQSRDYGEYSGSSVEESRTFPAYRLEDGGSFTIWSEDYKAKATEENEFVCWFDENLSTGSFTWQLVSAGWDGKVTASMKITVSN